MLSLTVKRTVDFVEYYVTTMNKDMGSISWTANR